MRRRKIWEVGDGYHCSILGTCLSLDRAAKILRKTSDRSLRGLSDYQIHGAAVAAAKLGGPAAKLIHKTLDRAYARSIARYAKLGTEEALRAAWTADVEGGQVPGAYWALMTHPETTLELLHEAFGTVHMLSHRVGGLNHDRLRRFEDVNARVQALEARLADERAERDAQIDGLRVQVANLEQCLAEARADAETAQALAAARSPERIAQLEASKSAAERAHERTRRQLRHALDTLERLSAELACLQDRVAPQPRSEPIPNGPPPPTCPTEPCEACDLQGSVILYVGGERGMLTHLREAAQRANSRLLHHDGGIEDGLRALPRLCQRADAVLCPMDRVSHVAVNEVKRACSASSKAFIPLRRSSLEAFERGLELVAARSSEDTPTGQPPT